MFHHLLLAHPVTLSPPPLCHLPFCWGLVTLSWRNSWSILQSPSPTSFSWQRIFTLFCSRRVPIRCTMTCSTVTASVCSDAQSRWPEKSSQSLSGQTTESLLSMIYKLRFQKDLQSRLVSMSKLRIFIWTELLAILRLKQKPQWQWKKHWNFLKELNVLFFWKVELNFKISR